MAATYTITIRNQGSQTLDFVVFQAQAVISAGGTALPVNSNSLGYGTVGNWDQTGTALSFVLSKPVMAAAMTNDINQTLVASNLFTSRHIGLSNAAGTATDSTALSLSPFGLSVPVVDATVPSGNFAMHLPVYQPGGGLDLRCGNAVTQGTQTVLSSYVTLPPPQSTLLCKPRPLFYVTLGNTPTGEPLTYDTSQAAACNFGGGYTEITVTRKADGSYAVKRS